ncbi:YeeE/YedE family protein [Novosphingobium lindaniclasticum]|uniref:Sulphur transport domain-containing protein n=1 Tax=Novosphingobium lindaniclasticum LE124 TaxID=1096930 RepID=T0HW45_9SPHN|nr:hypothetical protein [Novosphingobium lindaniclasticum]EQB16353.1 hypothetical protein L284_09560 [Novosphingobium lindaniclasticum LE124]
MAVFPDAMPVQGLIGGLLIGLSAAIMLVFNGRVAGCSGMFARAVGLAKGGAPGSVAVAFTVGLPIGAAIVMALVGVNSHFRTSWGMLALAGLLVGLGTRLGSGCTSGHGVVGMARLSPRSIAATMTFMATGIATVALLRLIGWNA